MATIKESGWYAEVEEEGREGYEFVAKDIDELVKYLDEEGDLDDIVTEWAKDYYDFEDFIREILFNNNLYADREGIIDDWKDIGMEGETTVDRWNGDICYFDEDEEVDADYIIDSDGEVTNYDEDEDEEEDDEEEEE